MKYYALGAVAAIALATGWAAQGWRMGLQMANLETALANAGLRAEQQARSQERALQAASDKVASLLALDLNLQAARTRTVTQEVIRYVQSPDAGQCDLPVGWVRAHDRAGGGLPAPADAPSGAADGASGVSDTDALIVVTANYRACSEDRARLQGWQRWWGQVIDGR